MNSFLVNWVMGYRDHSTARMVIEVSLDTADVSFQSALEPEAESRFAFRSIENNLTALHSGVLHTTGVHVCSK